MPERLTRGAGVILAVGYASFIGWLFAAQPKTIAETVGGVTASVGAYAIDAQAFSDGVTHFRNDRFTANDINDRGIVIGEHWRCPSWDFRPPTSILILFFLCSSSVDCRCDSAYARALDSPNPGCNTTRRASVGCCQALTQIAIARGDSLSENARALALLAMGVNDSLIVSFATKYTYNLWRPVTGIRSGDSDGNDGTVGDPGWSPFITTPCFPAYPSNHASGSSGGVEVLTRLSGDKGHSLQLTNPALGSTLPYTRLSDIVNDVDDARVYGGIHWRFDQEGGNRVGKEVGKAVVKNKSPQGQGLTNHHL